MSGVCLVAIMSLEMKMCLAALGVSAALMLIVGTVFFNQLFLS
jgi:hypothetical protein